MVGMGHRIMAPRNYQNKQLDPVDPSPVFFCFDSVEPSLFACPRRGLLGWDRIVSPEAGAITSASR